MREGLGREIASDFLRPTQLLLAVLLHQQVGFDLSHRFQRDADHDEERRSTEDADVLRGHVCDARRQILHQCDQCNESSANDRDSRDNSVEEVLGAATSKGGFDLSHSTSLFAALDEVMQMSAQEIRHCGLQLRATYAAERVAEKMVAVFEELRTRR